MDPVKKPAPGAAYTGATSVDRKYQSQNKTGTKTSIFPSTATATTNGSDGTNDRRREYPNADAHS